MELVKGRKTRRRGVSLGIVLLLVLVVATLGLTLAGGSSAQLWFSLRESNQVQATQGARTVVASTIEQIFESDDLSFGSNLESVEMTPPNVEFARLTFDPAQASDWGIPYSTSNAGSTQTRLGWGRRIVPAGAIHLVGVSRQGNVERTVEAFLRVEHFPYAIAASGQINTAGSLTVASLDPELPGRYRPADIVSNSPALNAITIAPGSLITGDAQAVGQIIVSNPDSVDIWGEVRSEADPIQLQRMDWAQLDPLGSRPFEELTTGYFASNEIFEGTVRRDGDLTINGNLEMDAAFLYVSGNLRITGDLTGSGIVVVRGNVMVEGKATLAGANKMALLAEGSIDLTGQGQNSSSFRGLVYTQQGFSARQVTVRGALVVDGDASSTVGLRDVNIYHEPLIVESTGPRQLVNFDLPLLPMAPSFQPDTAFSVVNRDNRNFEVYQLSVIDTVVEDTGLFLADPTSYPSVTPVISFPIANVFFDEPWGPGHEAATPGFVQDMANALSGKVNPTMIAAAVGTPSDPGPFIMEALVSFNDAFFGLGNMGIVFTPNQVLEMGEFLRPEERTRLLYWREGGPLAPN